MAARNDITGDRIKTKNNSKTYRDNWDAIFGKKEKEKEVIEKEQKDEGEE